MFKHILNTKINIDMYISVYIEVHAYKNKKCIFNILLGLKHFQPQTGFILFGTPQYGAGFIKNYFRTL